MSFACSFIFMQIKVISIRMVSHLDSFWNRGTREPEMAYLLEVSIVPFLHVKWPLISTFSAKHSLQAFLSTCFSKIIHKHAILVPLARASWEEYQIYKGVKDWLTIFHSLTGLARWNQETLQLWGGKRGKKEQFRAIIDILGKKTNNWILNLDEQSKCNIV